MLDKEELKRYSRHLLLPEVGLEGQQKLKNASVLVVGAGGLGCPALLYLAAAGVGNIGIADNDKVELSNLQRQVLFETDHLGKNKAEVAKEKLQQINPFCRIEAYPARIDRENITDILREYELVLDCTDNFPSRYLLNDACVLYDKILVSAALFKFEGQLGVFNYPMPAGGRSATYRCLFPQPPGASEIPNCAEIGILGVVAGILGTLQANEVIKIILGIGEPLVNLLLMYDTLTLQSRTMKFKRIEERAKIQSLEAYTLDCKPWNGQLKKEISTRELKRWMDENKKFQLIDLREEYEYEICHLEAVLVPLGEIDQMLDSISKEQPVVLYCHHGQRSASALKYLSEQLGFNNLFHLKGGIDAWAVEIDPKMERY